jgi:RNA polymerase sigma-70 factor (ECF subfamily)
MGEDDALWAQVAARNADAFEKLYHNHYPRVRSFLRIYLGDTPAVDDVAQDTFLQLWQRPQGFDPSRSSLKTYLFGIARKKAADWWRHQPPAESPAVAVASKTRGSTLLLKDAFEQLRPESRDVLWLREVEGYSYDELARLLDVPLGTVKSRLFAAREELRRIWKTGQ